jgi:hypothetical protein
MVDIDKLAGWLPVWLQHQFAQQYTLSLLLATFWAVQ